MAKDWRCAHCGTANAAASLTCAGCRRIQGSVVVPNQTVAPTPTAADQPTGVHWQTPAERPSRRGFAIGLGATLILIVGAVGAIIAASPVVPASGPTGTSDPSSPSHSGNVHEVSVTKLEIGDCFDLKDEDQETVSVVLATACTDRHQFELFHIVLLPEGAYPGVDWIETSAVAICQPVLERYTGTTYEESAIDFSWFYPDKDAWIEDDRAVQCFAYVSGNAGLTASLRAEPTAAASERPSTSAAPASSPGGESRFGEVNVQDLRQGDCWTTNDWEPNQLGNVTVTSCLRGHQFEVIWTGTYSSNTYPTSESTFLVYIDAQCSPAFEDYVGGPWLDSPYEVWWTYPSADRWLDGDRSVVCSAFDVDGPLSFSIKDTVRPD